MSAVVRLYATVYPAMLKPLKELAERFERFYLCLCDNCENRNSYFYPFPCAFRQNFSWRSSKKKCLHHIPIAKNDFLAERIKELTRFGLTLDEAKALIEREIEETV